MQHLTDEQIQQLKDKLLNEKTQLEESLGGAGRKDESGDWQAVPPQVEESEEDYTVKADELEEFFNRAGSVGELEARLTAVQGALDRIEQGTYGLSEQSGEAIEVERLMANPAATTTIAEMQAEDTKASDDEGIFQE